MEKDKSFYKKICENIQSYLNGNMNVLELACGFRIIIVIEANSNDGYWDSGFLQKIKIRIE